MFMYCFEDGLKKMEKTKTVQEDKKIDKARFEEAAYLLRALANETRLCVILQLSQTAEKSVTELMEGMDCEQSLLSHHLTDMRAKGILNCRKEGKNSFYSLKDKRTTNVLRCLTRCNNTDNSLDLSIMSEKN